MEWESLHGYEAKTLTDMKQKHSDKGQTPTRITQERHATGAWQVKLVLGRLDRMGVLWGVLLESDDDECAVC